MQSLPRQVLPFADSLNPDGQTHWYEPGVLWQATAQPPFDSEHSSRSEIHINCNYFSQSNKETLAGNIHFRLLSTTWAIENTIAGHCISIRSCYRCKIKWTVEGRVLLYNNCLQHCHVKGPS